MNTARNVYRAVGQWILTSLLCFPMLLAMANGDKKTLLKSTFENELPRLSQKTATYQQFQSGISSLYSTFGSLSIPKTAPEKRLWSDLEPLPTKELRLTSSLQVPLDYDPIRFGFRTDKDSIQVGEEVTLTITADLLPISPAMLFFFEEQRGFTLKVLSPKGFVQTGGSYQNGIGDKLTADSKTHVEYTIQGYFTEIESTTLFTLLRGPREITPNTMFMRKGEVVIHTRTRSIDKVKTQPNPTTIPSVAVSSTISVGAPRVAATAANCDILSQVQSLKYSRTAEGVNQVTVILKPGAATIQYSLNSVAYQVSSTLTPSSTTGVIYMRYATNPYCVDAVPFNLGPYLAAWNKADPLCPNCSLPNNLGITTSVQAVCSGGSNQVIVNIPNGSGCATKLFYHRNSQTQTWNIGNFSCSEPNSFTFNQDGSSKDYMVGCACNDGSTIFSFSVTVPYINLDISSSAGSPDANGIIRNCNQSIDELWLQVNGCPSAIQWYRGSFILAGNTARINPFSGNDVYTIFCETGSTTCSKSVTLISVNPITITATNNGICADRPTTLSAMVSGNAGPVSLTWSSQTSNFPVNPTGSSLTVSETGVYYVSTNVNGCIYSANTSVTLNAPPFAPAIAGPLNSLGHLINSTLTTGTSITLTAIGNDGTRTIWYNGASTSIAEGNNLFLTPTQSQTYFAKLEKGGCYSPNSNSIAITVIPFSIEAASTTICTGSAASLTALGCTQAITWQNMTAGTTYPTTSSVLTTEALSSGTNIKATCGSIQNAPNAQVLITVTASTISFSTTTICTGNPQYGQLSVVVTNASGEFLHYQYRLESLDGTTIFQNWAINSSGFNYLFSNLSDGQYKVKIKRQGSCEASSTVTVACNCGLAVSGVPTSNTLLVGTLLSLTAVRPVSLTAPLTWTGPQGSQFYVQSPTNTTTASYSVTGDVAYLVPNAIGSFTVRVQQPGVSTCFKDVSLTVRPYACGCTDCDLPSLSATDNPTLTHLASIVQNYVAETTYLKGDSTQFQQTISYIDGLGRPVQQVHVGAGGSAYDQSGQIRDIVSIQEYDAFGREIRKYLPYAESSTRGGFRSGVLSASINAYYNTTLERTGNAYTNITYEESSLNRPLSQTAPGSATAVTMVYRTNTTTDAVKRLTYVFSSSTISVSAYATNQLLVSEITNENNQKTVEFKDRDGQVVCREVAGLRTYYAYDDMGRLRCVVPPLASNLLNNASFTPFDASNDLLFAYNYDDRSRQTRKKIPGSGVTNLGYDNRDRLTSSNDAIGTTVITSYDDLDRVTSTSISGGQMLTQNFYDRYSYTGSKAFDLTHAYSQTALSNVQGMPTGTKIWGLGNASSLTLITTTYYDALGRVIQTSSDNHLGGVDKSSSKLDFIGRVLETKLSTQNSVVIETRQSYDWASRLKAVCQRVTDNTSAVANTAGQYWEPIARHNYNGIGELTRKTLGCNLQNLDYTYHMRGWLVSLNQPSSLTQNSDNDLFGMSLLYDGIGNIANWSYRSGQKQSLYAGALSQNALMGYSFGYDSQNRLKTATLTQNTSTTVFSMGGNDAGKIGYDDNGNILSLSRTFNGAQVDNLTYSYTANSNRLAKVQDASGNTGFFKDGANAGDDYTYDVNGNLTHDQNKGISGISYNVLNLPQTVPVSGSTVSYTYTATGQKLRAIFPGNKQYDYVAGLVYEGPPNSTSLEFIPTAEGRILSPNRARNPSSTTEIISNRYYRYEYHLKDHLGNLRIACRCPEISTAVTGSQLPGPSDTYPLVVMQEEQYDPWGLSLTGLTNLTVTNASRFKFNGKEDQQGLGWIDYSRRFYDPLIGRFISIDALAEKFAYKTPYDYAENKPINGIDLDGLEYVHYSVLGINEKGAPLLQYTGKTYSNFISGLAAKAGLDLEPVTVLTASYNGNSFMFNSMKELMHTDFRQLSPENNLTYEQLGALQSFAGNLGGALMAAQGGLTYRVRPQGITSEEFREMSEVIRGKIGNISSDIAVHGSRSKWNARPDSDIDLAVRVPEKQFNKLIRERFGTPNPKSAKEETMLHAIKTGKIQAGEAGFRGLRRDLERRFNKDVDISIIKMNGEFDKGPYIQLIK